MQFKNKNGKYNENSKNTKKSVLRQEGVKSRDMGRYGKLDPPNIWYLVLLKSKIETMTQLLKQLLWNGLNKPFTLAA